MLPYNGSHGRTAPKSMFLNVVHANCISNDHNLLRRDCPGLEAKLIDGSVAADNAITLCKVYVYLLLVVSSMSADCLGFAVLKRLENSE